MPKLDNNLPDLLFKLFIFIADADGDITPDEVQTFNELINATKWTNDPAVRAALPHLRNTYTTLWRAYDAGTLIINREVVAEAMHDVYSNLPDGTVGSVRTALSEFARRVYQPRSSLASGGGQVAGSGRQRSHDLVETMLRDSTDEASAVAQDAPMLPAAQAHKPAALPAAATKAAPPATGTWQGGRTRVRCVRVTPETADVKTYSFAAVEPCLFDYKPGQFVTLELPVEGRTLRRSYTISSAPSRPHLLSITVKQAPKGWISNWLYESMVPGFELDVTGPSGDFSYANHPSDKLLLISAGSGITPMMSMLRHLADTAAETDILFINNVRSPRDVIFHDELRHISKQMGRALRLAIIPDAVNVGEFWNGPIGRLNSHLLNALAPDLAERETFVCGPPGYMEMMRTTLEQLGLPMGRYHQESFGGAVSKAPTAALMAPVEEIAKVSANVPVPEPAKKLPAPPAHRSRTPSRLLDPLEVIFALSGKTVTCTSDETILEVGERAGVALDSSCRSGVCGACRLQKVAGEIQMDDQQVLNEHEVEAGFFLACCSHAKGPLVINA